MKLSKDFFSKIIFGEKINRINQTFIRNWLSNFFKLSNLLIRLLTIVIGTLIFCLIYFLLRQRGLEGDFGMPVFNKGSAFSFGSDWPTGVVYFTKSLVTILFFCLFIGINKWYCYIPFYLVFINSLCIIIDKSLVIDDIYLYGNLSNKYDTVVDYFYFKNFVNNIGDIFIITFSIISAGSIFYYIYAISVETKKKEGNE